MSAAGPGVWLMIDSWPVHKKNINNHTNADSDRNEI